MVSLELKNIWQTYKKVMKTLLSITLSLFLLVAPASAAEVTKLAKETTVNTLLGNGWKLVSTNVSGNTIVYTLMKRNALVFCKVSNSIVLCRKP